MGLIIYPKRHLKKLTYNGEYAEAIEYAKSIELKFKNDSDFWFIIGSIYFILEDSNKAITFFEKSLTLKDNDVETLIMKTNSHLALEQKNEAIQCCKKIIQIEPKNFEALELLEKLENI